VNNQIGVYDGHSTTLIAEELAKKLHIYVFDLLKKYNDLTYAIKEAFTFIEKESLDMLQVNNQIGGSTAICAIIRDKKVTVANVGDSRATIFRNGSIISLSAIHDYTNKDEEYEVDAKGGLILKNRLHGVLALSRSIGDKDFKVYMRSDPDIIEHSVMEDDEYLLLSTDGFWNEMKDDEVEGVINNLKQNAQNFGVNSQMICEKLMDEACGKIRSAKPKRDNMTLIVVDLKKYLEIEKLQTMKTMQTNYFFSE